MAKRKKNAWCYVAAVGIVLLYLLPIYILLNLSFRSIQDTGSKLALPEVWTFDNYRKVFSESDLWTGFKNSILMVIGTVIIEIPISALGAYGLARSGNKVAKTIKTMNMSIMMIPGVALLVGTYSLMVSLHMTNTLFGIILLTAAGGIPGTMFMYVNFVVSIPTALDEAAAIDGAGVLYTFFRIIMPQMKAVTVTRVIMSATACWNSYLMPMYLLQDKSKFTIILMIKSAFSRINGVGDLPRACAACVIGLLPVIVLYLLMQKQIIEGQIDSSVK
ncbi:MAG: carbohydrate ABC transporter permease [Lachnospiraceae bacterium]|nr:carbohydrate ABC transporter permease [Lachnospiraceae bacterium]